MTEGNGMKIAVFANTPAQVHFFRNMCVELKIRGHEVFILYRDYGETKDLIEEFGLPAFLYCTPPISKIGKLLSLPKNVVMAARYLRDKKVDVVMGFGVYDAYTSFLLNVPCIVFTDSEPSANNFTYAIQFKLYVPFVDYVITPNSYRQKLGKNHIKVNSYKELAYLHPNYYRPNDDIYDLLGIGKDEKYAILRFNAFDAVHDAGIIGFTNHDKIRLVNELEKFMNVFISTESILPDEIIDRVMKIPKNRIHDALYYSQLLVTDTQTMATEAAYLGVPTVRCNRFVGKNDMGNFIDLEYKYELMYNFSKPSEAIEKAILLANNFNLKNEWQLRRSILLNDKIDIIQFLIKFIETHVNIMKKDDLVKRGHEIAE
jgi:uncharacterized protein